MPRARTILNWTGATTCTLIVALWGVGIWADVKAFQFRGADIYSLNLVGGGLQARIEYDAIYRYPISYPRAWPLGPPSEVFWISTAAFEDVCWRPAFRRWSTETGAFLPLWLPLALAAPLTGCLFWTDRARTPGACPKCGYDRTGLAPAAPCPECGSATRP